MSQSRAIAFRRPKFANLVHREPTRRDGLKRVFLDKKSKKWSYYWDWDFPKVYVCQTSHHSLAKLRANYPNVTLKMVKSLYSKVPNSSVPLWTADIEISEFFKKTRPSYHLVTCFLDHIDCSRHWRLEGIFFPWILSKLFIKFNELII